MADAPDRKVEVLLDQPLVTELEIRRRTAQLAERIAGDYQGRDLVVVAVLKGAFMFAADLLRRLYGRGVTPDMDFVRAASYGSDTDSSGEVMISLDVSIPLAGRNVLLVDDIIDTGRTLLRLQKHLTEKGTNSLRACVLLDKPSRREVDFQPYYVGFEIPNHFVVGYGLDYDERYRYLPFITIIEPAERTGRAPG